MLVPSVGNPRQHIRCGSYEVVFLFIVFVIVHFCVFVIVIIVRRVLTLKSNAYVDVCGSLNAGPVFSCDGLHGALTVSNTS